MQIPRMLYKYHSFTPASIGNLATRQVWFSRPVRFNDPFDCAVPPYRNPMPDSDFARLYQYVRSHCEDPDTLDAQYRPLGPKDPTFRDEVRKGLGHGLEEQRFKMQHSRGVCCLSEKNDDLLMWSHYADAHKGFCLGFNTDSEPFSSARPVRYTTEVPVVNPISVLLDQDEKAFLAMILTKFDSWSYEKEWRVFHKEADTPFGYEKGVLQAVHFGLAMPESQKIVIGKLLDGTGTHLYQMERDPMKFAVVPRSRTFESKP